MIIGGVAGIAFGINAAGYPRGPVAAPLAEVRAQAQGAASRLLRSVSRSVADCSRPARWAWRRSKASQRSMAKALRAISWRDRVMASWARCWTRGQPGVPQEPVDSGLPAVGEDIPLVGLGLALIGEGLPLVGPCFTIVGRRFPRISQAVTLVGGVLPGPGICVTGPGLTAG
jgi:hypothetical protein